MKTLLVVASLLLIVLPPLFASAAGEFLVTRVSGVGSTVKADLIGIGYGWEAGKVTYISYFSGTYDGWDCPKNPKNGHAYMPWGLVKFTVSISGLSDFIFYVDFRDLNWATNSSSYPGADTHLEVDSANYTFTLKYNYGQSTVLTYGQGYNIWELFGATRDESLLGTPVLVENVYHNSNAGGTLTVGSNTISSGNYGVTPKQSTCFIGTNNERFVVGTVHRKHLNWDGDREQYVLGMSIPVESSPFARTAYFDSLQLVTIASALVNESSFPGATVEFRDPWYVTDASGSQPNTFVSHQVPFQPTGAYNQSSGGVFLNQTIVSGAAYYSVRAPSPVTCESLRVVTVFDSWTATGATVSSPSNTESAVVFTSTNGATVTANYVVQKPLPPDNVIADGDVGCPIDITWDVHPDQYVSYQIWRRVKDDPSGPVLLAQLSHSTSSYTDYDYVVTSGYTHDLVSYDVRAKYNPNSTTSDPVWYAVFARIDIKRSQLAGNTAKPGSELPTAFSVSCYPNPFNPSTQLTYQLKSGGHVSLRVYDVRGREIVALVDEQRSAGTYAATFNASGLASSIYFARLIVTPADAKPFVQTIKMVMLK